MQRQESTTPHLFGSMAEFLEFSTADIVQSTLNENQNPSLLRSNNNLSALLSDHNENITFSNIEVPCNQIQLLNKKDTELFNILLDICGCGDSAAYMLTRCKGNNFSNTNLFFINYKI